MAIIVRNHETQELLILIGASASVKGEFVLACDKEGDIVAHPVQSVAVESVDGKLPSSYLNATNPNPA